MSLLQNGDIVQITDGSWSLTSSPQTPRLAHILLAYGDERFKRWRVVATDCLLPSNEEDEPNDTVLVQVGNPGRITFIQAELCAVTERAKPPEVVIMAPGSIYVTVGVPDGVKVTRVFT